MVDADLLDKYHYSSRLSKAIKIERILADGMGGNGNWRELACLDVGCSIGVIAAHMAQRFGYVVGLDPLSEAIGIARRLHADSGVSFMCGDGTGLPFADKVFDVVLCAQVYEHTADPHRLAGEIWRVLKPGGYCFFSGPNAWWPLEYHYQWCCIHWLPRSWLHSLCQFAYGHPFDLTLYNYWQLRALWQGFEWHDYTVPLAYQPWRFTERSKPYPLARLISRQMASKLMFLLPNLNWLLVKAQA